MKSHTTISRTARLAGLAALFVAPLAGAHPGHAEAGLGAGLLHPLTGPDHLLALLAVGLLARQGRHGATLPPAFLVLAALGAACSALVGPVIGVDALEMSIAATVLLLGAVAACGWRLAPALALPLVGSCAFVHGLAHGRELAGMASGAGFLLASAAVMAIGALPGERARRIAGLAIGAAGCWLLAAAA
jgi:urease accessory protein